MSEERNEQATGGVIGDYRIVRLLGRGGMSEVYEAENVRFGSRHALKLFTYEGGDPEIRERFLVEGRLLARLSHPRIVKVTDLGTDERSGRPYFVMDLVLDEHGEMRLLSEVKPGTVDEETVGRWYDDLREGLAYIHANGVIHRDLKLQNVLIGPDGHAVLVDFGISRIVGAADGRKVVDSVNTLVKLRDGRRLVMGSVGYMAPELEMGAEASPQSDWYALGVIAYRLLTGTWCDTRTDVAASLETYGAAWGRIIPRLLHTNPAGRECLSFAEENRRARERQEIEADGQLLLAEQRGDRAVRSLRCALAALVVVSLAAASAIWTQWNRATDAERRAADAEARAGVSELSFETLFEVPDTVSDESDPTLDDYGEMWKCVFPILLDVKAGLSRDRAAMELVNLGDEEGDSESAVALRYYTAASNLVNGAKGERAKR